MALDPKVIELVREIALLETYADAAAKIAVAFAHEDPEVTAALEEATVADTEDWVKVRFNINDAIPNANSELLILRKQKRRLIRWTVRRRLGLPPVSDEELEMEAVDNASTGQASYGVAIVRRQIGRNPGKRSEI